ncbi:hypothetical protein BKA63DRAFT_419391 [Paraphoma chrysanthemicola]|nr:hypothetical protein BKA63DRAFT_419391 [Paraphoma chrysanthemicola]
MRHPAAPTVIAILLGFLIFMVVWARWRSDGHHEGNPHPDDVPKRAVRDDGGGAGTTSDELES